MKFPGTVLAPGPQPAGIVSAGAPAIEIQVGVGGRSTLVRFDIDTGAAVTVLTADDASTLLGVEYELLDFRSDPRRIGVRGFTGENIAIAYEARLTLRNADAEYSIDLPILIAPPAADRIAAEPLPSLLGRDVLRHFRLELNYGAAPQVLLETL